MADWGLDSPVVLKPDKGQHGQGVAICRDFEAARAWLKQISRNYIMMAYLPGQEFGLFYYRFPNDSKGSKGKIFSINRKKFIAVTGDGRRTLEELILKAERAVCLAPMFFKNFESELLNVVPEGESVQLGEVGTHSLGSLFLDGSDLITPELLDAVEEIVKDFQGFNFGRFDIKVPSEEDFKAGKNLMIVELNGLTSEATHIYDPRNSIVYAWQTLIKQWSLAFEIADQNCQKGHKSMSFTAFIRHCCQAARSG